MPHPSAKGRFIITIKQLTCFYSVLFLMQQVLRLTERYCRPTGSSVTLEKSSKTQWSGILHVCGKCYKWIWLLLIFFLIIDHLFLTLVWFLLNGVELWRFFLMSTVSCLLTKSACGRSCKGGKGGIKSTKNTEVFLS